MGQPKTQTEIALDDFRKAGVPIEKVLRPFVSKKMQGFNAEVYSTWIQRWAVNAAANYPVVKGCSGVSSLRNCAKDVPAVVVGIGPSLDENISDLKRAPRHAVIIATDAALRPLARHGIHPDLVLNFDARDEQETMWETIDTSPYVLLANSVTSPFTIDAWKGSVMFFNMMQNDDEFCTNILPAIHPYLGELPNMGTVGNGAVFLAYHMGCRPILTVGMDLCYQKTPIPPANQQPDPSASILEAGWKYRCQDWNHLGDAWLPIENKTLYDNSQRAQGTYDETIKGIPYRVDKPLSLYRESLLAAIGKFDLPVINCSGGVLSNQILSMPLLKALEEKCYAALEPMRTSAKFLRELIGVNRDWRLVKEARIFVPTSQSQLGEK
jgi:hypothetical protein